MSDEQQGGTPPENDPNATEDTRDASGNPYQPVRQGPEDPNPEGVADPEAVKAAEESDDAPEDDDEKDEE